jgi:DNA-binding GntR family transcriptional regulator
LIVTGAIRPGEIVQEQQLSAQLEIGRTPVREALQRLAGERVLTIIPRRGIVVAKLGMPEVLETFEARITIEAELARLAATRHTTAEGEQLRILAAQVDATTETNDFLEFLAADQLLHHAIAAAGRNRYLASAADHLLMMSDWFWHQFVQRYGNSESPYLRHDVIVDAIIDRDCQRAREAMCEHIQGSRELLKESF